MIGHTLRFWKLSYAWKVKLKGHPPEREGHTERTGLRRLCVICSRGSMLCLRSLEQLEHITPSTQLRPEKDPRLGSSGQTVQPLYWEHRLFFLPRSSYGN